MHEVQIGFQLYREVLGMTPETIKAFGSLVLWVLVIAFVFWAWFGDDILKHRRDMKDKDVQIKDNEVQLKDKDIQLKDKELELEKMKAQWLADQLALIEARSAKVA